MKKLPPPSSRVSRLMRSPADIAGIRVPMNVYDPPMAPAPEQAPMVPLFGSDDVESIVLDREVQSIGGLIEFPQVYKTRKAWKAIDVYLDLSIGPRATWGSGTWSALVFASHQGGRSLVGAGRWGFQNSAPIGAQPSGPQLVASVRGVVAQHFEVDITGFGSSSAFTEPFRVIIVARDCEGPALPGLSAWNVNPAGHAVVAAAVARLVRVVHASVVNNDAIAKRVMLVENAGLPTEIVHFQGGLQAAIGATFVFDSEALRSFVWPSPPTLRAVTWPGNVADNNVSTLIRYQ